MRLGLSIRVEHDARVEHEGARLQGEAAKTMATRGGERWEASQRKAVG